MLQRRLNRVLEKVDYFCGCEAIVHLLMLQLILHKNQIKKLKMGILYKDFEVIRCTRYRYERFLLDYFIDGAVFEI
jgi:hypothetical protein